MCNKITDSCQHFGFCKNVVTAQIRCFCALSLAISQLTAKNLRIWFFSLSDFCRRSQLDSFCDVNYNMQNNSYDVALVFTLIAFNR